MKTLYLNLDKISPIVESFDDLTCIYKNKGITKYKGNLNSDFLIEVKEIPIKVDTFLTKFTRKVQTRIVLELKVYKNRALVLVREYKTLDEIKDFVNTLINVDVKF